MSAIIAVIAIGILYAAWIATSQSQTPQIVDIKISKTDHVKGNRDAKVILVEYSDLQCPACRAYFPIVKEVLKARENDVFFVYRHYPLSIHKHANAAAYAAEAAGKQDKFWQMHDLLFENQDEWAEAKDSQKLFEAYAEELKLNLKKFRADMRSKEIKKGVDADIASGNKVGVGSTPTFFLNGEKLRNPRSPQEFIDLIEKASKDSS